LPHLNDVRRVAAPNTRQSGAIHRTAEADHCNGGSSTAAVGAGCYSATPSTDQICTT
jgi:hypothetical protein